METEKIRISNRFRLAIFEKIVYKVSSYCLQKVYSRYLLAKSATATSPLQACTGTFRRTFRLPCEHIIFDRIQRSRPLEFTDIVKQYLLISREIIEVENDAPMLAPAAQHDNDVLNPMTPRTRGRPVGATADSTHGNPSAFEYVGQERAGSTLPSMSWNKPQCKDLHCANLSYVTMFLFSIKFVYNDFVFI